MDLELHSSGQNDYLNKIEEKFNKKIQAVKNSEFLTSATKKVKIKTLKKAFLKEKKEVKYNSY